MVGLIDVRPLKAYGKRLPPCALSQVLAVEDDSLDPAAFCERIPLWLRLAEHALGISYEEMLST